MFSFRKQVCRKHLLELGTGWPRRCHDYTQPCLKRASSATGKNLSETTLRQNCYTNLKMRPFGERPMKVWRFLS
jgi:hypothetical protein